MSEYLRIAGEDICIRKYGVVGNGRKSVIKIEIEVSDPVELGWMLRTIGEAQQETQRSRSAAAAAAKKKAKTPKAVEQRELLGLPYYGGRS